MGLFHSVTIPRRALHDHAGFLPRTVTSFFLEEDYPASTHCHPNIKAPIELLYYPAPTSTTTTTASTTKMWSRILLAASTLVTTVVAYTNRASIPPFPLPVPDLTPSAMGPWHGR